MVIEQLFAEFSEFREYLHRRIETLRTKCRVSPKDCKSIEGMMIHAESILKELEVLLQTSFSENQKIIFSGLYSRGYALMKGSCLHRSELQFKKQFAHKQIRVCVNINGFRILMDGGAGLTFGNSHSSITPNARRIDFVQIKESISQTLINALEYFEKRASDSTYDLLCLEEMQKTLNST